MELTKNNAFNVLKKYLGNKNLEKYNHSIRVAKVCKVLSQKWDISVQDDAIIAGLLHDIGKSMNKQELLSFCTRKNLTIHDFERFTNPMALHGKVSSLLFEDEFSPISENSLNNNSQEIERVKRISHAISSHVAGSENMTTLDKIVFIADNIEPHRSNNIFSNIQAGIDYTPNECMKIIINDKISRAVQAKRKLNPILYSTLNSIER